MKILNQLKYRLMRKLQKGSLRDTVANRMARRIGKTGNYPGNTIIRDNEQDILRELNENGYFVFDTRLNSETVEKIKNFSYTLPCYDPYHKLDNFDFNTIPEQTHVANYYAKDLMNIKEISDLANDPKLLGAVESFLGCTPTLSSVNMWWSIPGKASPEAAQNFHRDIDDYRFVKLFIYLTDVDENSGPHVYVKGSSQSQKLRQVGRFSDQLVEETFGKENVKYFTDTHGKIFLVDTYGIHKGLLPKMHKRLLLQFEYSINPVLAYSYSPVSSQGKSYNRYVNRLFYS